MSGPHFLEGNCWRWHILRLCSLQALLQLVSRICIELCSVLRVSMAAFVRMLRLVTPTVYDCKRQDFLIAYSILFYHDTADIFRAAHWGFSHGLVVFSCPDRFI